MRKFLRSSFVTTITPIIGAAYLRFVYLTSRKVEINKEYACDFLNAKTKMLGCFWHGRLCIAPYTWKLRKHHVDMLISTHNDGRMISNTVHRLGIGTIEGSTGRGGATALKKIVFTLRKKNSVCYTPDGPRGPRYSVGKGGVIAAKLAQVPMIPVGLSCRFAIRFSSWDHFLLPLPFNKIVIVWGEPIHVPQDTQTNDIALYQDALKQSLHDLTEQADDLCNRAHHIDDFEAVDKGNPDET